jgi:hypothetical protein
VWITTCIAVLPFTAAPAPTRAEFVITDEMGWFGFPMRSGSNHRDTG